MVNNNQNIFNFLKKNHITIVKWFVLIASLLFIVNRIFFQQEFKQIFNFPELSNINNILYLLVVFLLMLLNWGIESFKWKLAVNKFNKITFLKSYSAILSGISVSIFMPNRTGEFVGRIFFLKQENRVKGIFASVISGFSQLVVTIICGSLGIMFLYILYPVNSLTEHHFNFLINIPVLIVAIMCIIFYFKIKWIVYFFEHIKFLHKYINSAKTLNNYSLKELTSFLVLSFIRYSVFLLQFYFIIKVFRIDINILQSIIASSITFYVSTLIPTFAIAEIGLRGTVAAIFFGFFSNMQTEIIFASMLLWLINIGFPAFAGNIFIAKHKIATAKINH